MLLSETILIVWFCTLAILVVLIVFMIWLVLATKKADRLEEERLAKDEATKGMYSR